MNVNKIRDTVRKLVNYGAAVAMAAVFALYLSGRVGWFILAAFLGAPVVSLLLTLMFVKRIYVSCEAGSLSLSKGDRCGLTVSVANGMFLPTPPVYAEIFDSPSVKCSEKLFTVSVMPYASESFSAECCAVICGPSEIGVRSVKVSDYFGLFSFELKGVDYDSLKFRAAVIPDIADVPVRDALLTRAEELAAFSDDSEDTTDSAAVSFGGFPGYDSREYIPGDPLKRINWKQSAKRGRLLVRLDDETACSAISIVLDSCFMRSKVFIPAVLESSGFSGCTMENVLPMMAEDAVEYSLGLVRSLVLRNYSVSFFLLGRSGWENYSIADESDMAALRTELASYSFSGTETENRFPHDRLTEQKGSVSIFCTPYYDESLKGLFSSGSEEKGALKTVVYSAAVSPYASGRKGESKK